MAAPQVLQVQFPATFGFSAPFATAPELLSAVAPPRLLAKQALQVRPLLLLGSNGSWVIAPPQVLQVQFP